LHGTKILQIPETYQKSKVLGIWDLVIKEFGNLAVIGWG
jgi:hypothetical protein